MALTKWNFRRWDSAEIRAMQGASWMRFVPQAIRQLWADNAMQRNWSPESRRGRYLFNYRLATELHAEGAKLLMGGAPQLPYKLHGISLLEELDAFEEAGFDRWTILCIATRNAAEFLGRLDSEGTIAVGSARTSSWSGEIPLRSWRAFKIGRANV